MCVNGARERPSGGLLECITNSGDKTGDGVRARRHGLSLISAWMQLLQPCCFISELRLTPCDPTDCSPPGSSVHGISQARILEWVAISSSRGSFRSRDQTLVFCVSRIGRQISYPRATWEAPLLTLRSHFKLFCAPFSSLSMTVFN